MKTKKLLSILLVLAMVVSMVATLGITASAGQIATWVKVEKYGKTFWYLPSKVDYSDDGDEIWQCECWEEKGLTCGKFAYNQEHEDWYDEAPCDHIVTSEPISSVEMKSNPTKTNYAVGDTLDLTGAKITATTISETTQDVNITSSMVSGFDSTTAGTKTVTVTFRGYTTTFDVTVASQNECYLDLESSTTDIKESKTLDQNYNLTVNDGTKTDVTKVKLSWTINDINATRTDNKVWDTENLCWKTDSSSTEIKQAGTAKFTLENYSSVMVDAKVTFDTVEYATGKKFTAPTLVFDEDQDESTEDDGKITLETAAEDDTYSKTNVPTGKITVTVTPDADDFKTLAATTTAAGYGTYTVTISKSLPTSFVFSGFYDGKASNATINGMNASAFCQYMVDNGMITDASQFGAVLVKYPYYSRLQKKNVIGSRALSILVDTTQQEYGTVTGDELLGDNDYTSDKSYAEYFNGSFTWDGSSFVKNS